MDRAVWMIETGMRMIIEGLKRMKEQKCIRKKAKVFRFQVISGGKKSPCRECRREL